MMPSAFTQFILTVFFPSSPLTCDELHCFFKMQPRANYAKGAAESAAPLEARSGPRTEGRIT